MHTLERFPAEGGHSREAAGDYNIERELIEQGRATMANQAAAASTSDRATSARSDSRGWCSSSCESASSRMGLSTERKRAFFALVREITGGD